MTPTPIQLCMRRRQIDRRGRCGTWWAGGACHALARRMRHGRPIIPGAHEVVDSMAATAKEDAAETS